MSNDSRVVSGIVCSGFLHLGNYLGAIKHWKSLQTKEECLFFIADLHAITVEKSPQELQDNIYETLATYLACGIDPEKVSIFVQSHVRAHAELGWILTCQAPMGWLKRMTQFKTKTFKDRLLSSSGLFTYPALMAADILLYDATHVPVGDDQKQHLEFTRDIAEAFNTRYNEEIFTKPEPLIMSNASRVMSLKDARHKMSKSEWNDISRINLKDDDELITIKIRKAKTDSISNMSYDPAERKELTNLINIYSAISGKTIENIINQYQDMEFLKFKEDLTLIIKDLILPISKKISEYKANRDYLDQIMNKGAEKANMLAEPKIELVKKKIGFVI